MFNIQSIFIFLVSPSTYYYESIFDSIAKTKERVRARAKVQTFYLFYFILCCRFVLYIVHSFIIYFRATQRFLVASRKGKVFRYYRHDSLQWFSINTVFFIDFSSMSTVSFCEFHCRTGCLVSICVNQVKVNWKRSECTNISIYKYYLLLHVYVIDILVC